MFKIISSTPNFYNTNIDSLPDDVLFLIFSKLPKENLPSTACVCRTWNKITLDQANNREPILRFTRFLVENVEQKELSIEQIEILKSISEDNVISEPKNLLGIKSSILDLKVKILQLLLTFSNEEVLRLKNISESRDKPHFLEEIFELSEIYRQIKLDTISRSEIAYFLVHKNKGNLTNQDKLFTEAAKISLELSYYEKAFEIAKSITDERKQSSTLKHIFSQHLDQKNFEKAFEVAKTIPNERKQIERLITLSLLLQQQHNFKMAIDVANAISYEYARNLMIVTTNVFQHSESISGELMRSITKGVYCIGRIAREGIFLAAAIAGKGIALTSRLIKKIAVK